MQSRSAWQKVSFKMQSANPTTFKKPESKVSDPEAENPVAVEKVREVPKSMEDRSGWQKNNIKMKAARPTGRRRPKSGDSPKRTYIPYGLENAREVPRNMESRSTLQKSNIKPQAAGPTTWSRPKSENSAKETGIPPGLETSGEISTKMDNRSSRRKANVKVRAAKPSTGKRPKSADSAKENGIYPGLETSREFSTKMDNRISWKKASIMLWASRPTTWRRLKSGDSARETGIPPGLETGRESPTKREGRSNWRKASIKLRVVRPSTWKRPKSADSDLLSDLEIDEEVFTKMDGRRSRRKPNIRRVSRTRIRPKSGDGETSSSLETGTQATEKSPGRKAWHKVNIKMEILKTKARILSAQLKDVEEGTSKFVLAHLQHYTVHPNLIQYYEPLKVTEPQNLLDESQNIKRFMSRVSEFDQNKTLLIMTNNPPPSPVNWQEKDEPPSYFSQELLVKPQEQQKIPTHSGLPLMKKKLNEPKTPFAVVILEDAKPKQEQWYRFSTKDDFKSEAKFSKLHAIKRQQEMYPELSFVPDFRSAAREEATRQKVSMATWEPLTLTTLLEENPTLSMPLSPEKPFRYGRAPQWRTGMTLLPE